MTEHGNDWAIRQLKHWFHRIPYVHIFQGPRSRKFCTDPQANCWTPLLRCLSTGWLLTEESAKHLPRDAPWRQETEAYLGALAKGEGEAEGERNAELREAARKRKALKDRPPVWYAIPSADPAKAANCLVQWQAAGYRTAVLLDAGNDPVPADLVVMEDAYRGYPAAGNKLARLCVSLGAEIVITGGDDIYPDAVADPKVILREFIEHFAGTFGVMQPTGDRWGEDAKGVAPIEKICGSPWMGREFIRRINQGCGPWWEGYRHFFCDEEMQNVVEGLGILWQRPDICQYHDHWSRQGRKRPPYMAVSQKTWDTSKALFLQRKATGFPGSEPLCETSTQ